jgi:MFS family permease
MRDNNAPKRATAVLVGVSGLMFMVTGLGLTTLAVFIVPIRDTFHLSATEMFLLTVIALVGFGAAGPLVGWLMERAGARLILSISAAAAAASYVLASFADSFVKVGFLMAAAAVGVGASTLVPGMILAKRWLPGRFGLAMGWIIAAYALGGAVMPPIIGSLITRLGWRLAMDCTGVAIFATAMPIILFLIRDRPCELGSDRPSPRIAVRSRAQWAFWSITALLSLAQLGTNGAYYAFVPFGADLSYSLQASSVLLGVINVCSAAGCLAAGMLADRLGVRWVLLASLVVVAACMALPALAFAHVPNPLMLIGLAVVFGLVRIVPSQLVPVLLADIVGEHSFGTMSGSMTLIGGIVGAMSPVVVGYIHDLTGTYAPAMLACAGCTLLAMPFLVISRWPIMARTKS